jgi:hypothetical protein
LAIISLFLLFSKLKEWHKWIKKHDLDDLGTQSLLNARQALYHINHTSSPFCFSCFSDRGLHFCWGPASDFICLLLHMSPVQRGLQTYATILSLFCGGVVLLTFCQGWTKTMIFPISACWVTGNIGISHHVQLFWMILL